MKGTDQVGFPLRERLCLLNTLPVSGKISVARTYHKGFDGLYRGLSDPLDEGVVLKDPEAVLAECHRDGLNANWQLKCRRGTKKLFLLRLVSTRGRKMKAYISIIEMIAELVVFAFFLLGVGLFVAALMTTFDKLN